jgi:hypothetical protein
MFERVPTTPDSWLFKGYLQDHGINTDSIWAEMMNSAPWVARSNPCMLYRGNELKRGKFFLMAGAKDVLYKYGYPGFQWLSMENYKHVSSLPVLQAALEQLIIDDEPLKFNHIIGTMYEHDTDEIGPHSDRVDDIEPDTDIYSLSFGDIREFEVSSKISGVSHVTVLRDGDLFVLGPLTNATMNHSLLPVSKETHIKRSGSVHPRISIVLRQIHTKVSQEMLYKKVQQSIAAKKKRNTVKSRVRDEDMAI